MERLFLIGPQLKTEDLEFFQPDTNLDEFFFVDSGFDRFLEINNSRKPLRSQIIGDQDSSKFAMDIKLNPRKEESDLAATLRLMGDKIPYPELCALGFLGGRKDHEIFNLMAFAQLLEQKKSFVCHLSRELVGFSGQEYWNFDHRGTFSLWSYQNSIFHIEGEVVYPLEATEIPALSSRLLSNEAEGEFRVKSTHSFFFYRPKMKS